MTYLTAEQIAERAEKYNGTRNRAEINRLFRRQDESHLYPVNNRFNATERAIRRLQRDQRDGLCINDGLEYALALEMTIGSVVNGAI